ncbi:DeoD-type purine-nucleoside phosphorylase [Bogoriella caseilytica]|uniref:Uridine phosphorylase n=1 Tax=Bogoriella caseilytica TaxID=56055 RepID=A0A3N2B9D3_9MICO|nr:DeoD-type purine-nucleoside phosphorylase [Bogoriella caseilytica]ROR71875.1 purine-nucleoside phosphorylase [Bogoriella caseilytica]
MATPHISAAAGQIAPAVLMPGDPRRADRIAALLMPEASVVSEVRGNRVHTGTVNGQPLSVMASGMGMPSLAIYATELFDVYDVQRIIRVGTAGGLSPDVAVGDVLIALGAHTDSAMIDRLIPGIHFSAVASYELIAAAVTASHDLPPLPDGRGGSVHVAPVVSRDGFYGNPPAEIEALAAHGTLGVEMEAAALYGIAASRRRQALAVCTVSDHLLDGSADLSPEQREKDFERALTLALAAAHA